MKIAVPQAKTANDGVEEGMVRVSSMSVHAIDVNPPRPAFRETFKHVTFHLGSIADKVGAWVGEGCCILANWSGHSRA